MPYAVKWSDEFVERLQQWRNDHPKIGLLPPSFSKANGSEAVVNDCLEIFERLDDPAGNFNGFDKSDKVSQQVLPFSNITNTGAIRVGCRLRRRARKRLLD